MVKNETLYELAAFNCRDVDINVLDCIARWLFFYFEAKCPHPFKNIYMYI